MQKEWWKRCVIYQVYPRSFKDSNGDGIGDLRGIIEKLDYIKLLGADMIWLNPIYKSPNDDNGYDISDYRNIMDEFGTMKDFDELLSKAHQKGIKIMMDLVVNHTSDEHQWFIESRKSKDNPYRDYYVWKSSKNGKEPNNWRSFFQGSVWQYDENTNEYYLHLFSKKQPDLNWENVKVRKEVHNVIKFWLDKGIDGFRMDAINHISKDQDFPDGDIVKGRKYVDGSKYFTNGPRVHEFLQEIKEKVISKYNVVTVGEAGGVTPEIALDYIGDAENELDMVFNFEHIGLNRGQKGEYVDKPIDLVRLKKILSKWQYTLEGKGWNSLYWSNHDQARAVSTFGNDKEYRVESAKMIATCLYLMKGTPFIYQGEEIGMTNVAFYNISDYKDIGTLNEYKNCVEKGIFTHEEMMRNIHHLSRENSRTPMQWDNSENAGFTKGKPWIKVNPNYKDINVENEINDPSSIFNYYRKLIKLKKSMDLIIYGRYNLIMEKNKQIFAYTRTLDDEKLLVVCNFTNKTPMFNLPSDIKYSQSQIILYNYINEGNPNVKAFKLRPYESKVFLLKQRTNSSSFHGIV